ncbi:hypothetical protein SAMN04488527_101251 [Aliiroseovarius crassostreae]|uniref:Bacteriophage T7 Gp17 C-terminal domain-containing protein n=1 Tax=Aliiroseovarius crassostreae TaxID=154981 RepID=A0A0P7KK71_9RHOB|nr:hypothetical protein [Aliiroseovarius crassostreae]KPN64250.1 hypothetical protein AKJ29_16580 [Aliiroseovarius crassostreae]SFU30942.1 hypothetical protein SAMN04488527_101251 [Aliiroseovarius crassostreae]
MPENFELLPETVDETWPGIPMIMDGWPQSGGLWDPTTKQGLWNLHALYLLARTNYLKQRVESVEANIANLDITGDIDTRINQLIDGAPAALDTLNELAVAIGDNDNELAALVAQIAGKLGVTETAANADKLSGQHGSYYRDASNLNAGTVPDARLPARLGPYAQLITDWDDISECGGFKGYNAANSPGTDWWLGTAVAHDDKWITVTAHQFTGDSSADTKAMRREKNGGVWGAWYPLVTSEAEVTALTAPHGQLMAWARWNGMNGVTINASSNVSSIVRVAAGIYDVRFATELPNSNYMALAGARHDNDSNSTACFAAARLFTTSSFRVIVTNDRDGSKEDAGVINIGVFG